MVLSLRERQIKQMKIKIYIATQTQNQFPKNKNYVPLIVGKSDKNFDGALNDSKGESISEKNRFYCELTGQYWIWKNDFESEIVGLCHYRRYLWLNEIKRRLCKKNFPSLNDEIENYLDTSNVNFDNYDIILPRPYAFSKDNIKSQFISYHGQKNFDLMMNVLQKNFPQYKNSAEKVFNRRFEYFANLIIAPKKLFDDYSEWLFKILFDVENNIDLNDEKNFRLLGYMSERLLNVYVIHNNLRIKEVPQIFITNETDEKDLYIDFRYMKRRYFSGILNFEEKIRNKIKSR